IEHVAVGHVADVLIVQVFLDELGIISLRLDVGQQVGDEVAEDGIGQADAVFGYFIPYLLTDIEPETDDPELIEEDLNDEDVGNVPDGDVFDGSNIRVEKSFGVVTEIRTTNDDNGNPQTEFQRLEIEQIGADGRSVAFGALVDPENTGLGFQVNNQLSIDLLPLLGGGFSFFNGQIELEFLFRGEVVDTFTNAELFALIDGDALTGGTLTISPNNDLFGPVFDQFRFVTRTNGAPAVPGAFGVDNIILRQPAGNNIELIESRDYGVAMTFVAPVGATVSFFDLYDRPLLNTIELGEPGTQQNIAFGDFNDDGIPEYNDGLGRIEITGVDQNSRISFTGLQIEGFGTGDAPEDNVEVQTTFAAVLPGTINLFDEFEEVGFGFEFGISDDGEGIEVVGLPPGTGSVIIGSPFIRPQTNYDPYGVAPGGLDFQRSNQGIFVNADAGVPVSIGQLATSAALFGLSNFSGSVGHLSTGYLMGSIRVGGDLGSLYNATDAGGYVPVPDDPNLFEDDLIGSGITVGSQISVGRTIGEVAIAGRNFIDITVDGDLSNPSLAPADDVLVYDEREVVFGISTDAGINTVLAAAQGGVQLGDVTVSSAIASIPSDVVLPSLYGDTYFRNDTILNAEYVGGASSAVVVRGVVGAQDPVNTGIDQGDVFAFAADGTNEIIVESLAFTGSGFRLLDSTGRTVAASELDFEGGRVGQQIRFTPDAPGVYYLSVIDGNDGTFPVGGRFIQYSYLISGIAPTTFGSYRTGLGGGGNEDAFTVSPDGFPDRPAISVLSGSIGTVRVGVGYVNNQGQGALPVSVIDTFGSTGNTLLTVAGISVTTPRSLFAFTAGGDVNAASNDDEAPVTLSIGEDLGEFTTGGDASFVFIETGGRVGTINIGGNLGADETQAQAANNLVGDGNPFSITTGLNSDLSGDIGFITVGGHVAGDQLFIDTSAQDGAVVGGLITSTNRGPLGQESFNGINLGFFGDGPNLNLGAGSDIRFVDTPQTNLNAIDNTIPIFTGQVVELVDDAGGVVEISVSLETAFTQQVGQIIVVPVEGSEGVAIARIEIDLAGTGNVAGGVTLNIRGVGGQSEQDIISIGRIVVGTSDIGSQIIIDGSAQIDVWRIDAPNGVGVIENRTPGGDIVAVDTLTLTTIRALDGDLGRTQVPEFGPRVLGPRLGLQFGVNTAVFGALGVDIGGGAILDGDLTGIFRPTNNGTVLGGAGFADEIGFPFDDALNGVVVRTGGLELAEAAGAIGDVILQGGDLLTVRANQDLDVDAGEFDGIIGTIFSPQNIDLVDVGSGLLSFETGATTPFAEGGVFAQERIRRIEASRTDNAFINGYIFAAESVDQGDIGFGLGIDSIFVDSGGSIFDTEIGVNQLDTFWNGTGPDGDTREAGLIRDIRVIDGDLFRSRINSNIIETLRVFNGAYDATVTEVRSVTNEIAASEFRNSTLEGEPLEFRESRIRIGEDIERITTIDGGSISDTAIDVIGEVRQGITARSIIRSAVTVANTIRNITLTGDLLASEIVAGQLITANVQGSIRVSSITVSGPIVSLRVQDSVDRSRVAVTGPDGRIDLFETMNDLDAEIISSGRIGTIRSSMGSIDGSITTTNERADIVLIDAEIDILATTDIGGDLNQIEAGRNIGDANDPGVVLVRGDLSELDVEGGRLFSDLRVGGTVSQGIVIGPAVNLPNNVKGEDGDITVFGRLEEVEITGDFDGRITSESSGIGLVTITDGSLLAGGGIIANDGGIGSVSIIRGHLLGTVYAELTINSILVDGQGTAFGDIGINPNLSAGSSVNTNDPNRNQLPPGVVATLDIDGPTIASGRSINSIVVTSGDIYEAFIFARNSLGVVDVRAGNITTNDPVNTRYANVIAAGDLVQDVRVSGNVRGTLFLAGVTSFGDESIFLIGDPQYDDRPGNPTTPSTSLDADTFGQAGDGVDTLKSGTIRSVSIGGDATNVDFSAGITAGDDGQYNTFTGGERNVLGLSIIDEITIGGTQTNVTVSADRAAVFINGTNVRGSNFGASTPNLGGELANLTDAFTGPTVDLSALGTPVPRNGSAVFVDSNGVSFRVEWTAPGSPTGAEAAGQGVIWDAANNTLILANTRIDQSVVVTVLDNDGNSATTLPDLVDFDIRSNDEASIGTLRIQGENGRSKLAGDSNIVIDNFVRTLEIDDYEGTGAIRVGEDIDTLTVDRFAGGASVSANFVRTTNVRQSLVSVSGGTPRFDYTGASVINVTQNATAVINVERSVDAVNIGGSAGRFEFRAGGSLGSFEASEVSRSRLSVSNVIGSIDVAGNVFDSAFIAGGDLGSDVDFDREGDATASGEIDRATSGTINTVDIGGNFTESDLIAGFLRGPDGFFATPDDDGAAGNSLIGSVDIGGTGVGSNVNSETFGLLSAGGIQQASIAGEDAATVGNFIVGEIVGEPVPIQVTQFRIEQDARVYTAFFSFDQDIDETSFAQSLRIREIRDGASAQMPFDPADPLSLTGPTAGVLGSGDYSIEYDEELFIFAVTFDRAITDRDLLPAIDPADPDQVVAGTRQNLPSAGIYRFEIDSGIIRARNAQARLDGDGNGFAPTGDDFSFDDIVGDAGDVAGPRSAERVSLTGDLGNDLIIDFYEAIDLNLILDSNLTPDGLPEINTEFTLRGALADHPDRDLDLFGFGGDKDVYSISLQAGQILRLGEVQGPANQLSRSLYFDPTGGGDPLLQFSGIGADEIVQQETDQTIILPSSQASIVDGELVTDSAILIKESGTYFLVVESGEVELDETPTPFAGPTVSLEDRVANEDPDANQIGNYAFSVEVFDDGNTGFNAANDAGDGTNVVNAPSLSLFSTSDQTDRVVIDDFTFQRLAGADGVFGNADDIVSGSSSDGSIVSTRTGTRLESTISSSIGPAGSSGRPGQAFSDVDVFHLNNFQPITAGTLVTLTVKLADAGTDLGSFSGVDFSSFDFEGGAEAAGSAAINPNRNVQFALFETTASNDQESADLVFSPTDFSSRAGTPDTVIAENGATRYGFDENGDFFITFVTPESVSGGDGSFAVYLQGVFEGDYEIEVVTQGTGQLVSGPQNFLIETAGGEVDWLLVEGEPFAFDGFDAESLGFSGLVSNVDVGEFIVDSAVAQLNAIFASAGLDVTFSSDPADFEFEEFSTVFLSSSDNATRLLQGSDYGVAERSDPFNTDREDEAIIFTPIYSTLGYSPSPQDLDAFIDSLTNGIARRAGELVGLRLTDAVDGAVGAGIDVLSEESIALPFTDTMGLPFVIANDSRELTDQLGAVDDTGFFFGDQNATGLLQQYLD
ncbi:MAG: hypothetical protein AAFR96_08420, partial [Planctomycetota bacterium]